MSAPGTPQRGASSSHASPAPRSPASRPRSGAPPSPTVVHNHKGSPKSSQKEERASPKVGHVQLGSERENDSDLVTRRLKAAYGFGMPDAACKYIADIHSRCGSKKAESPSNSRSARKLLGRDVKAVSGQVVKHIMLGKRADGSYDGDYSSGGGLGTIVDVCGDSALVRWNNGNERFYFIGNSPWRKDATGVDTDNARAIRSLVLHEA